MYSFFVLGTYRRYCSYAPSQYHRGICSQYHRGTCSHKGLLLGMGLYRGCVTAIAPTYLLVLLVNISITLISPPVNNYYLRQHVRDHSKSTFARRGSANPILSCYKNVQYAICIGKAALFIFSITFAWPLPHMRTGHFSY